MIESDIHARRRTTQRRLEPRARIEIPVSGSVVLSGVFGRTTHASRGLAILVQTPARHHGAAAPLTTGLRDLGRLLEDAGIATLQLGLLTKVESEYVLDVFDSRLLASRLAAATSWLREHNPLGSVPIGYVAAGAVADAAVRAGALTGAPTCVLARTGGRIDAKRSDAPLLVLCDEDESVPADGVAAAAGSPSRIGQLATDWLAEQLADETTRRAPGRVVPVV